MTSGQRHEGDSIDVREANLSGRRRLALWLILLAILILSAEIMIRVSTALLHIDLDTSYGYPADLFVEDPELGFALKPGFVGTFPNPPYDKIEIRINHEGYRDREFGPRSDRTRIVVVGDSITFGAGVRAEDRFTDRLAASLCEGRCEVLNLGVNNYQAENYIAQLRRQIATLAPDWVILGFCMNDIRAKAGMQDLDKVRRTGAANRIRELLSHSQLVRVSVRVWRALTLDAQAYDQRWIRLAIDAWSNPSNRERLAETLREIRSLVKANGAKLAVVLFPEKHQLQDYDEYGLPYEMAQQTMSELDVPVVSLLPPLSRAISAGELPSDGIFLPQDNIHFTPRAHAWIAEVIKEQLGPLMVPEAFAPQDSP
jgi:lysophospholipase L1-like esterase